MSKDAFYFSHDSNARHDDKILSLRLAHGWEGYGIFWAIIEMLRDATDHKMQMDYKRIAFALQVDCNVVQSVIEGFKLFYFADEKFGSKSLDRRMAERKKVSDARRKAAEKRWVNANALQVQSKVMQGKERKGKEKKEKERNNIPPIAPQGAPRFNPKNASIGIEWLDDDLWCEWIEHKKKRKASLSKRAIDANIAKLEALGPFQANKIIAQSLDRGWTGIFPLKEADGAVIGSDGAIYGTEWEMMVAEDEAKRRAENG